MIRKKSILVGIGIISFIVGTLLSSKGIFNEKLIGLLIVPMLISPMLILMGYFLLFIGYKKISG
jgi:hypothetical protein